MAPRIFDGTGIFEIRRGIQVRITHPRHAYAGRHGRVTEIVRDSKRRVHVLVTIATKDGPITTRCGHRSVEVVG